VDINSITFLYLGLLQ